MINSYLARGTGIIMAFVLSFFIILFLIDKLDKKHNILLRQNISKFTYTIISVLFAFQLTGYLGLWATGFWEKMVLYDLGTLVGDPNKNPFWLLMRITSSWFILPLIKRSEYKASLRLDPKVLLW